MSETLEEERKAKARATRSVYQKQHARYSDATTFQRFVSMYRDPSYYGLKESDFVGKRVLDIGCGNTGYLQLNLFHLGCRHVTCVDIGTEWQTSLAKKLEAEGVPSSFCTFLEGSADALPLKDKFDFVFSNGVLIHLNDKGQAELAFKEMARVTKQGGYLYIVLGCPGGIFERYLIPAFRTAYAREPDFKKLIDTLSPEDFGELATFVDKETKKNTGETIDTSFVTKFFDEDLCISIQNLLQVPTRLIEELNESWLLDQFRLNGFEIQRRCKRFVKRENIRKFFAPMHFNTENRFSRIFYGEGNLEFMARKI